MDTKETLRLAVVAPLVLSAAFSLAYTAIRKPGIEQVKAQARIDVVQTRAASEMAILQLKQKTSADTKEFAFAEHDRCVSLAEATYLKQWEAACKSSGQAPDCSTLDKSGPLLNVRLEKEKVECKQRFEMRMQP